MTATTKLQNRFLDNQTTEKKPYRALARTVRKKIARRPLTHNALSGMKLTTKRKSHLSLIFGDLHTVRAFYTPLSSV